MLGVLTTKGRKETLGGVGYICYLDVVIVLWAFAYVQTQMFTLSMFNSLHINYTSMKLF